MMYDDRAVGQFLGFWFHWAEGLYELFLQLCQSKFGTKGVVLRVYLQLFGSLKYCF